MNNCLNKANALYPDIFPIDCIEILKSEYKGRLEIMSPLTIFKKVKKLMQTTSGANLDSEIVEAVNNYIGEF